MKMCVSIWVICIVFMAINIALSSALRMLGYPGNLSAIWILLLGLYTLEPAVLPTICPSEFSEGGMNEPSVYMHCCGWYLRGCMRVYVEGRCSVILLLMEVVWSLGAVFHAFENLM